MKGSYLARFDWFMLKPLWMSAIFCGVLALMRFDWLTVILMLGTVFFLGVIGASLWPNLSYEQLASGRPSLDEAFAPLPGRIGQVEAHAITKAYAKACLVIGVDALILSRHIGLAWPQSAGIAVMSGSLLPILTSLTFWIACHIFTSLLEIRSRNPKWANLVALALSIISSLSIGVVFNIIVQAFVQGIPARYITESAVIWSAIAFAGGFIARQMSSSRWLLSIPYAFNALITLRASQVRSSNLATAVLLLTIAVFQYCSYTYTKKRLARETHLHQSM